MTVHYWDEVPEAWVVRCMRCSCVITCRALDPKNSSEEAPKSTLPVTCSCCGNTHHYHPGDIYRGKPARGVQCPAWKDATPTSQPRDPRERNTIAICASVIAAIRLHKEEIRKSPKVVATVSDSVNLAKIVLEKVRAS